MNRKKHSFQSQKLIVDWISFKFQDLSYHTKTQIVDYLFNLGFNTYQQSGKLSKPIKEGILVDSKNKFEVCFVQDNSYWSGTLLHFSGSNATRFYSFAKEQILDWTVFSSGILSRFDTYFERYSKKTDKMSVKTFFENSYKNSKSKNKNLKLEKNTKGLILRIGNRRSNHYSRIYQTKMGLKFEYEMKGKALQPYHLLLVESRFEEFEQNFSSKFTFYFGRLLPLQSCYLDWLTIELRPFRKQPIFPDGLNSDYIKSDILMDTKSFVSLIQFLNYAHCLDFEIEYLGHVAYRKVVFKLRDFLQFQDPNIKSTNQYRLRKIKEFFKSLQTGVHVTSFDSQYFQSLTLVPQVKFKKCSKQKFLIAEVWLVNDLFTYNYPFYLPNFFQHKLKKHQLEVGLKLFQAFNSLSIEKTISVEEFFRLYPSVLENKKKTEIKKYFIQLVDLLREQNLIESYYKVFSNGNSHDVQELTIKNISEGFMFYEKIDL